MNGEIHIRREALLALEGMHCTSCAAAVERSLLTTPGVVEAQVSFASDCLRLVWVDALAPLASLQARVLKLGYRLLEVPSGGIDEDRLSRALDTRLAAVAFSGMWVMLLGFPLWLGQVQDRDSALALWSAANVLALPALLYAGWPFYRVGWLTLRLRAPGMDSLVLLGVSSAVVLTLLAPFTDRLVTYADMALTLLGGQLLAKRLDLSLRRRARESLQALMAQSPSKARVVDVDGVQEKLVTQVQIGERVELFGGDAVPVDGVIHEGEALIDRALRTGESLPEPVAPGEKVFAGDIVLDARLVVEAQAVAGRRWLDRLSGQIKTASAQKGDWHKLSDRYARHFIAIAAALAGLGAVVALAQGHDARVAVERAVAVFVIACPCALSFAAPLASRLLTLRLARAGFLLRDPMVLERYRSPDRVFLDKTGTLTTKGLKLDSVHLGAGVTRASLLAMAAKTARGSSHPVARAIIAITGEPATTMGDLRTLPGSGQRCTDPQGNVLRMGSAEWLSAEGVAVPALVESPVTRTHVAMNAVWLGALDFEAQLAPNAADAVAQLKMTAAVQILSGDRLAAVKVVAATLGVHYAAGLSPADKLLHISQSRGAGAYTVFAGDGLNDGPALAAADLGMAVGGSSALAKISSSVVLERGGIERLPELLNHFACGRAILRQNLFWALAYNGVAAPLAIAGLVHPATAALAMAMSTLTVVLNTCRLLRQPRQKPSAEPLRANLERCDLVEDNHPDGLSGAVCATRETIVLGVADRARVSCMRKAASRPDNAVSVATTQSAAPRPKASAVNPASSAPTA
jgi:heavy metal translocating P-type ATPase